MYLLICKFYESLAYLVIHLASESVRLTDADILKSVRVTIPQGVLEGRTRYTTKSLAFHTSPLKYFSFEGIPYAQPPKGNLRFKNPLPPKNWSGVYDATNLKNKCPQITEHFEEYEGYEDCLYINVYSRKISRDILRPVFFIIHGGRFRFGAGNFRNPLDLLLEIDPIIVTFNYRLHILGLFSLNNEQAPGNLQNKDQVLALRWVKNNIEHFGGDPNNVAIYGLSSGATDAYLLQMSPMAKGLFHKSILASGAFLCNWHSGYEPSTLVKDFGNFIGLETNNTEEIYQYLMKLPAKKLVQKGFDFELKGGIQVNKFSSSFENTFDDIETFLPLSPSSAYKAGLFFDIPTMISYTSMEYTFYLKDHLFENYTKNDDLFIPQTWDLPIGSKLFNDTIWKIKQFYFKSDKIDLQNREHLISYTLLMGDLIFFYPINEVITTHAEYTKHPLYVYRFSYRGGLNFPNIEKYGFQGATHSDDKAYIYPNNNNTLKMYSSDNIVRQRLLLLYQHFIETSNPTPDPDTSILPFEWPVYTNKHKYVLSISGDTVITQDPDSRRANFWIDLEKFVIKEGNLNKNWKDICSM